MSFNIVTDIYVITFDFKYSYSLKLYSIVHFLDFECINIERIIFLQFKK